MIQFVPVGESKWNVTRNDCTIAVITDSRRGLILTVENCGLDALELEAVANFMVRETRKRVFAEHDFEHARRLR